MTVVSKFSVINYIGIVYIDRKRAQHFPKSHIGVELESFTAYLLAWGKRLKFFLSQGETSKKEEIQFLSGIYEAISSLRPAWKCHFQGRGELETSLRL